MPPTDYTDSFVSAARIGAIDADLAAQLKPSGGLRNALIHGYGDIDDERVHRSIPLAPGPLRGVSAPDHPVVEGPVELTRHVVVLLPERA